MAMPAQANTRHPSPSVYRVGLATVVRVSAFCFVNAKVRKTFRDAIAPLHFLRCLSISVVLSAAPAN